jgi:hypothetical protein
MYLFVERRHVPDDMQMFAQQVGLDLTEEDPVQGKCGMNVNLYNLHISV